MASHTYRQITNAILIIVLQITTTNAAKIRQDSGSPVYEIINEQARIDDKVRLNGNLPYGNPLAGNSLQNARQHAQHQQAMFNAERMRQHRAQLQRWAQISQVDSYMKAYHDSQEDHQLAVEQQQANLREKQSPVTSKAVPRVMRRQRPKLEPLKKGIRVIPEAVRITKENSVKTEKSRSHRSYGSTYHQYLQPKLYKNVYVSPAPTYDQGVTIKPNGNVGLTGQKQVKDETILFTEAVPSKTQYVYPKQYGPMQGYQSAQDIETLKYLLKKNPHEQLKSLNALIKPEQTEDKDVLDSNIDLYFYKDTPTQSLVDHYDNMLYAQVEPQIYASAYTPETKDHTPITEEVDDIEDPNKYENYQGYGVQSIVATEVPEIDTTTTKSNNYYKVEVASQIISSGYKPTEIKHYNGEEHENLNYIQPLKYYFHKELNTHDDGSVRYLHHNAKPTGVQHLTEDGSGVSAYDEDSLQYAANYEFGYRIRDHHTGNDFGHHEAKSGENTNGHYHVLLPDGRMQNVQYTAGPEGFHADVSYDLHSVN
ncbi:uncharacterized protein LOC106130386 [Amyelois transitella]|uniref:uncharacterized protein LOC106130386 n=1 Tax=Amyelois transitella TaxID=680683 RepID=UPI00299004A6|nr:uncharacterized protein LOC106130386 [Amyelois transitella]XP_060808017.1 uncharacterized protein LOC106130386 [Amyelois transitella]